MDAQTAKRSRLARKAAGFGVVAGISAVASLMAVGTASAAPLERFTFTDEVSEVRQVCGVEVEWRRVEHGSVGLIARGSDELPSAVGAFQGSATYTNVETGASATFAWRSMDKDLRLIDNGDGTTTAVIQVAGNRSWWVDGRPVALGTGVMRVEVLIDNGGTPSDPSDDSFIREVSEIMPQTGQDAASNFDLCAHLSG